MDRDHIENEVTRDMAGDIGKIFGEGLDKVVIIFKVIYLQCITITAIPSRMTH